MTANPYIVLSKDSVLVGRHIIIDQPLDYKILDGQDISVAGEYFYNAQESVLCRAMVGGQVIYLLPYGYYQPRKPIPANTKLQLHYDT